MTHQEIIKQLSEAFDRAVEICGREFVAKSLLERFGAGGGEPVAFIQVDRHGEEELLWTKDDELEGVLYGYTPLYTHPSPTDLRAEYERGLEDAEKVCEAEWSNVAEKMYGKECAAAIRALKSKQ